jgi:hypothetical protein
VFSTFLVLLVALLLRRPAMGQLLWRLCWTWFVNRTYRQGGVEALEAVVPFVLAGIEAGSSGFSRRRRRSISAQHPRRIRAAYPRGHPPGTLPGDAPHDSADGQTLASEPSPKRVSSMRLDRVVRRAQGRH